MSIVSCNAALKMALVHKNNFFFCSNSKESLSYIRYLYKQGYLVSYQVLGARIKCILNIYKDKYVLHNIVNYKKSHQLTMKYKKISDFKKKNSHSEIIIYTNYGIMNNTQCFFRKKGGLVFSKLN